MAQVYQALLPHYLLKNAREFLEINKRKALKY